MPSPDFQSLPPMTAEQFVAYAKYLADFDPSPIGNGEDFLYPLSADSWLEEQEAN